MINGQQVKLLRNAVLASAIEAGMQTKKGLIIPDDNVRERGIRPRWCKVYKIGPEVTDIEEGDWILVEHGRWSHGFSGFIEGENAVFRWIDHKDILLKSDTEPSDLTTI